MQIYAMQPACNYVYKSLSYAHLRHAVSLWLCMPVHVIMYIYAMQLDCNFVRMSLWPCMHVHVIMLTYAMKSAWTKYAHLCFASSL